MQWAVVKTVLLLRIEPPQYGLFMNVLTRATCQGYSLTLVTTPPTILVALLGMPQVQVEASDVLEIGSSVEGEDADVVITGSSVSVVDGSSVIDVMDTGFSVLIAVVRGIDDGPEDVG